MDSNYKIQILLAAFNGQKYISTQLDSILNQSHSNWELFVSDDGSSDDTVSIIQEFCNKDSRIRIINEELTKQGACQNFGSLLETSLNDEWDFLMFADQDDYWHENKIELSLDAMLNAVDSDKLATLVYTDFEYAGDDLSPLKTETDYGTYNWKEASLPRLLAQNNIYGCTMMANRLLAEKTKPIPFCAENHDYWIALVAASIGQIVHVKKRVMLYRQHSNNVSGHYTNNSFKKRFFRYFRKNQKLETIMCGRFRMAEEVYSRFSKEISNTDVKMLLGYSDFKKKSRIGRIYFCFKNKIQKDSLSQTLAFYFSLMRL